MTISTPDLHRSPPITLRHVAQRQPWLLVGAVALAVVLGVLAAIDGGRLLVWDRPIPIAFHWVLAAFILAVGESHRRRLKGAS